MNGIKRVLREIDVPDELRSRVLEGIENDGKRSVNMNKITKIAIIAAAAMAALVLFCAAGFPFLRGEMWGESATVEKTGNGQTVIMQSIFDPASYKVQSGGRQNMIYFPEENLNDSEAEIMTVFAGLANSEDNSFKFYDGDSEITDVGSCRMDIGGELRMVGPWSEFTLIRTGENEFEMRDGDGDGFNYYIYPLTGDTKVSLDFCPTGFIHTPEGSIKTVENGAGDFTLKPDETALIGDKVTLKKGDRIKFTVKLKNVPDEALGDELWLGFRLDPSDPMGESEGPGYTEGERWSYPCSPTIDGYLTEIEYPVSLSGEYQFNIQNVFADYTIEVESISVSVTEVEP